MQVNPQNRQMGAAIAAQGIIRNGMVRLSVSFDWYRGVPVMSVLVSTVCWAIAIFFIVNLPWCFALPITCAMLLGTWMIRTTSRPRSRA
jgi:hypothetical protein